MGSETQKRIVVIAMRKNHKLATIFSVNAQSVSRFDAIAQALELFT